MDHLNDHQHKWGEWERLSAGRMIRRCDCGRFQAEPCHGEPGENAPCPLCHSYHLRSRWKNLPWGPIRAEA